MSAAFTLEWFRFSWRRGVQLPFFSLACLVTSAPAFAIAIGTNLSVLTYNVAGLPGAANVTRNALISPKLDASVYDVVAVQEAFDATIYSGHANNNTGFPAANTPAQEAPTAPALVASGLMRLSNSSHTGYDRQIWNTCENTDQADCLASKGFSFSRHDLGAGAEVDIYNWHAEAGNTADDVISRNLQITQMLDYIGLNSIGRAVLLLGDSNSRYTRTSDNIRDILDVGFNDAWLDTYSAGNPGPQNDVSNTSACGSTPNSANCELKDKIFFRSGNTVELILSGYDIPSNFADDLGDPLSDHEPVTASFTVNVVPEPSTAMQLVLGLTILGMRRSGARA